MKDYRELRRVQVNEYAGRKDLSFPSFVAEIIPIRDLEHVCSVPELNMKGEEEEVVGAVVTGVNQL